VTVTSEGTRPEGALRRLLARTRFLLACLFGGSFFLLASAAGLLWALLFPGRPEEGWRFPRAYSHVLRTLLGWRFEIEGKDRLPHLPPCVVVCNHQSNLDTVWLGLVYPPRAAVVVKKELLRVPVFGWFVKASGQVLIDRENPEKAISSLREAARRLREERLSLWVFPEGHRNRAPELLPFKKGAFHIAVEAQVPIVPVVCEPLDRAFDAGRWMVRPSLLRVEVLPEVSTAGRSAGDVDALAGSVRSAMQSRLDSFRASSKPSAA
jgi:lysophosphatidate acyltransferase